MIRQEIPLYLQKRLKSLGVNSIVDVLNVGYFRLFAYLRDKYPSTSYKTLYDLYCIASGIPLNSLDFETEKQLRLSYQKLLPCYSPLSQEIITKYLGMALDQAEIANVHNEIPIGAVVVKNDIVIGYGYNQNKAANKITKHAEIVALEMASAHLDCSYLSGCDLYVTLEPCLMCSGAIMASRVKRLIFGAAEPKTGAIVSQYQVFNNHNLNHHTEAIGPVNTAKYSYLLRQFLHSKR